MHIGLYFGSFNPIHTGHLIVANVVAQLPDIQEVWFVVSPHNPLKEKNTLLNEYDRLHLVNLAIKDNNRLKTTDVEFKLPKPSYTIDTLVYLKEKYPQHSFSVVLGSDSFENLERWKNAEVLVKETNFIIYKRPGFEIVNKLNAKIKIVDAPLLDISATYIRNKIKEKQSIQYLLPDDVIEEIDKNNYYK